jgi:hypothetical protein
LQGSTDKGIQFSFQTGFKREHIHYHLFWNFVMQAITRKKEQIAFLHLEAAGICLKILTAHAPQQ